MEPIGEATRNVLTGEKNGTQSQNGNERESHEPVQNAFLSEHCSLRNYVRGDVHDGGSSIQYLFEHQQCLHDRHDAGANGFVNASNNGYDVSK